MFEELKKHFNEVIKNSNEFNIGKPCNNVNLLFPPFYEKVKQLIADYMEEHETEPYILETYRSNDLQMAYYNRGASQIKRDGMHHFGIAVDLVALINGKPNWNILDYEWLRARAVELGLTVLSFETCHFQYIPITQQGKLRNAIYS